MGRLTQKDEQGNWMLEGVPWRSIRTGQVITRDVSERLVGALYKLFDYENTDLSPDAVEGLKDDIEYYRQLEKETENESKNSCEQ